MRIALILLMVSAALSFSSCGRGGESTGEQAQTDTLRTTEGAPEGFETTGPALRAAHDCEVKGKILEGNQFWIREKEILICIVADSTTLDPNLGDSHRILEVYDTKTCDRIERTTLPVNVSSDFPYYLAEITYNTAQQLVGIKGFASIYCYDVENRRLMSELKPVYRLERYGVDAQSGMIKRLEVWENYLIGYAQDYGTFLFDLRDKTAPRAVKPFAETRISDTNYGTLFLIPSGPDTYQAILPGYDLNTDRFTIRPLFDTPKKISLDVQESARNNRYLVLRELNEARTPVAIDLQKQQQMNLPPEVAGQNTQEILKWMRANG